MCGCVCVWCIYVWECLCVVHLCVGVFVCGAFMCGCVCVWCIYVCVCATVYMCVCVFVHLLVFACSVLMSTLLSSSLFLRLIQNQVLIPFAQWRPPVLIPLHTDTNRCSSVVFCFVIHVVFCLLCSDPTPMEGGLLYFSSAHRPQLLAASTVSCNSCSHWQHQLGDNMSSNPTKGSATKQNKTVSTSQLLICLRQPPQSAAQLLSDNIMLV